jgi:hypothetical protein
LNPSNPGKGRSPFRTDLFLDFNWSCKRSEPLARVARWYIFKPKKTTWVNFVRPWNGKSWYILHTSIWNILRQFGIFHGHLVHFVVIWYILTRFGIVCQEKSGNPAADL